MNLNDSLERAGETLAHINGKQIALELEGLATNHLIELKNVQNEFAAYMIKLGEVSGKPGMDYDSLFKQVDKYCTRLERFLETI